MHDELCVLCGIQPACGPLHLFGDHYYDEHDNVEPAGIREIAREVLDSRLVDLESLEVTSILHAVLAALRVRVKETRYHLPVKSMDLGYEHDVLAIGHFYATGKYAPFIVDGHLRHPTGDDVETRRVHDGMNGIFSYRVHGDREDGTRALDSTDTYCDSHRDTCLYNFFVHIPCFHYLRSWLLCQMPPRTGRRGQLLTLAGELYEVVNSQTKPRGRPIALVICYLFTGDL